MSCPIANSNLFHGIVSYCPKCDKNTNNTKIPLIQVVCSLLNALLKFISCPLQQGIISPYYLHQWNIYFSILSLTLQKKRSISNSIHQCFCRYILRWSSSDNTLKEPDALSSFSFSFSTVSPVPAEWQSWY